jgi:hypothetical protein
MALRMRRTFQLLTLVFAASLATACAEGTVDDIDVERRDPATITWVAPTTDEDLVAGDVVTLTVSTANTDAHRIDFSIDGTNVGTCDADDPMSDCREENLWSISTTFDAPGTHTLAATFTTSTGHVVTHSRAVTVLTASTETPVDPGGSGMEMDPAIGMPGDPTLEPMDPSLYPDIPEEPGTEEPDPGAEEIGPDEAVEEAPEEVGDLAPSFADTRGYLDPNKSFHNVFRGRRWAVRGQRILLRRARLDGDVYRVAQCMQQYGEIIARYADNSYISRASVLALMIAETNCTNPAPQPGAVRAGPLAIRASVCSALNPTLSHHDCLLRMSLQPSAGIETAVRYLRSATMRRMHHNDPIKLAAVFHVGALRRTHANAWHLVSPRGYLTRFAQAYNAYRSWEALGMPLPSAM